MKIYLFQRFRATIISSKLGIQKLEEISELNALSKFQAIIFSIPLLLLCLFTFILSTILDIIFFIPDLWKTITKKDEVKDNDVQIQPRKNKRVLGNRTRNKRKVKSKEREV